MPLGGYCEVCGRWVWVDETGACQFGHPATSVREVQELSPRSRWGSLPAKRGALPPDVRRRDLWWWRHSLWLALTLSFGFLNWLAYFYIGLRSGHRPWIFWGFVYLIPVLLTAAAVGTEYVGFALALQLFVAAVSFLHAAAIRPRYRALMLGAYPEAPPAPPQLPSAERRRLGAGADRSLLEVLNEAESALEEVRVASRAIAVPAVRGKIDGLVVSAHRVLTELRRRPQQIGLARGFLGYYLDALLRIVRGYAELSANRLESAEVRETLARAEAALDGIQNAFDAQLNALMQQRVLDLDNEIALLESTVRNDGLLSLPAASAKQLETAEGQVRKGSA